MLQGERARDRAALERLAWALMLVLRSQGAKVTMGQLLGEDEPSPQEKWRRVMRAQFVAEGKDPALIDRMVLSPSQQLEAFAEGKWPFPSDS